MKKRRIWLACSGAFWCISIVFVLFGLLSSASWAAGPQGQFSLLVGKMYVPAAGGGSVGELSPIATFSYTPVPIPLTRSVSSGSWTGGLWCWFISLDEQVLVAWLILTLPLFLLLVPIPNCFVYMVLGRFRVGVGVRISPVNSWLRPVLV